MKTQPVSTSLRTRRDVVFLRIGGGRLLAFSCDAAGGIGSKPHDTVRAEPRLVGKLTTRVALMELLAVGADPIALVGTFPVEPEPTGNRLLAGMMQEVREAGLRNLRILCSSEKNVRVNQTGIGVTAIGLLSASNMKVGRCRVGDEVVAVGRPFVGQAVVRAEENGWVAATVDVIKLRRSRLVHELIPIGSRGIFYEAGVVAEDSGLLFNALASGRIDLKKSAGPATVLLAVIRNGSFGGVRRVVRGKLVAKVGVLSENR